MVLQEMVVVSSATAARNAVVGKKTNSRFDGGRWWRNSGELTVEGLPWLRREEELTVCCRLVVAGEEMAAATAVEGGREIRVRVSCVRWRR